MKNIIITLIIFIFVWINNIQAIYINPKVETLYNKLVLKLEKNKKLEEKISLFSDLKIKIKQIKNIPKYKYNKKIIDLLDQIIELNDKYLFKLKKDLFILNLKKKKENENTYEKEYLSELENNKKIINSYSYSKYFKNKSYTKNNLVLEDWIWYWYFYKNFSYFPDDSKITKRDLDYNWINLDKDLLFVREWNKLWFVKNPKKVRLIDDKIISDIKNKYYLLEEIKDDFRIRQNWNYDKEYLQLKTFSQNLTKNFTQEEKIKKIYDYILNNTKYSSTIDFKNYKIFSWIETYLNNDWICEWYAKIMIYMLMFSWVEDTEVIRWYVIDATDFPEVWHAWVKVWGKYYDPTFDDPVWATKDKKYNEYNYFWLPKDLFYTNRFSIKDLPEEYRTLNLKDREKIIQTNLYNLYNKYKNDKYNLLKLIKFKKKYNIKANEEIIISNFNKILPLKVVNEFKFNENWKTRSIINLKYFEITNFNLEAILKQLDYNLDWKYFFLWYDENWNSSYKLGYDVKIK